MRILVCGIPGTGKTTFAQWLSERDGYLRYSADGQANPLEEIKLAFTGSSNVVVDWGFPPNPLCLDYVSKLAERIDIEHWWFDGDREAALQSFLARGTVPKAMWDLQLERVDRYSAEIAQIFEARMLNVISRGLRYTSNEERLSIMEAARKPSSSSDAAVQVSEE